MMKDWYEDIEEPIRELVWRLRNNGINTTCSCGHDMYVQADLIADTALEIMHKTVYNWWHEQGKTEPNYTIDIHMTVIRGITMQCFAEIRLKNGNAGGGLG